MMNQFASALSHASPSAAPSPAPMSAPDDLIKIFNTALVSTQSGSRRDFSGEIYELMESPAFRAVLSTVRQFARLQGLSERQAAEQIITTFRKMDQAWADYVFQQGLDRLKGAGGSVS